jgi:cystathionine beta-lyase family protein involved in aluminum resistance
VGPHHFQGSTGYGHGDLGRSTLDDIMASIMGAEAAAVRIQFVSGTHAIAAGLFSCLRPGDELLAVAGHPYDTLEEVIGVRGVPNAGSLCDFGVSYRVLELTSSGNVDFEALQMAIRPGMDLIVHICNGNYAIAWLYGADYY